MDLSTNYLGLRLSNPFVAGPSHITGNSDTINLLEEAGIGAVVLPPLFEEQLRSMEMELFRSIEAPAESFPEALSYFAEPEHAIIDVEGYVTHVADLKKHASVPVIAAINAVTRDRWIDYAKRMEDAGVDALELDFYFVASDPGQTGDQIEAGFIDALTAVKGSVRIPVSVKVTPFHTSLACFARNLEEAGADGIVLFHRFYEPDIDIENLEPISRFKLSDSRELLLRLRWLAIISAKTACCLAASGGIHSVEDTIKAIMTGADCVQITSVILKNGAECVKTLREGIEAWLTRNEYGSLSQMRGSMNLERIPDPAAFSREHYMHMMGAFSRVWGGK